MLQTNNNPNPRTFDEFRREVREAAGLANVIPVVRTPNASVDSPIEAFARLARKTNYAFLFESVEGGEKLAQHSFIGINPEMIVRGRGEVIEVEKGSVHERLQITLPEFLREHFRGHTLSRVRCLAPLAGGAVGYLGFQATQWFEPAFTPESKSDADDSVWMFFKTILAFDQSSGNMEIVSAVFVDEAEGDDERLRALYETAVEATLRIEAALETPDENQPIREPKPVSQPASFVSNWTREAFEDAVGRVKNYILAGDCYQTVISQCFTGTVEADPFSIYRALRATNPSPYMFYLRLGAQTIIGTSPEMLVRCRERNLDYRPIAGTRPRGVTDEEDLRLGWEMQVDEKEIAEHVMLVDLGRNDLGRVAEYGSVQVGELMSVECYSHVQHLVSGLHARLRPDLDRFDALAACFPAGTVTGAPKVRAMEIIQELEPEPRGVYSGAVLYADYADNLDSCIAIRTMVIDGQGKALVQAGAGIVADSVPEREYEETITKARALFRAVEMAERPGANLEIQLSVK